jgi:hypothetical protein
MMTALAAMPAPRAVKTKPSQKACLSYYFPHEHLTQDSLDHLGVTAVTSGSTIISEKASEATPKKG